MFVDYTWGLSGVDAIKDNVFACLDEAITARFESDWSPPIPITGSDTLEGVEEHTRGFTQGAVCVAGLIDGINPCAISTLVFFMSMLLVSRIGSRGILLMGISFCTASFITYTAIGFGFLRCLHLLEAFPLLQTTFETMLAVILVVFACVSIRDAVRYRRTQAPEQIALQLPHRVKMLIHTIIRKGVKSHHLLFGGFFAGCAVTALETVCTGQVYVPALTVIVREGGGTARVWSLLLLYNTMFIMPLVTTFILVHFGLTTKSMLSWSRRNVPLSKTLLGLLFLTIAAYLLW